MKEIPSLWVTTPWAPALITCERTVSIARLVHRKRITAQLRFIRDVPSWRGLIYFTGPLVAVDLSGAIILRPYRGTSNEQLMAGTRDEYNIWIRHWNWRGGERRVGWNCSRPSTWSLVAAELNKSEQAFNLETRGLEGTVFLQRFEGCNRSIFVVVRDEAKKYCLRQNGRTHSCISILFPPTFNFLSDAFFIPSSVFNINNTLPKTSSIL